MARRLGGWGTGTILIYKIDVWQIFDFGGRCLGVTSAMTPSTRKSQLEKYQKGCCILLLLIGFRKLQRRVWLTAESAESTFEPSHANGGTRWGNARGAFGKSICCTQSLLVASELVGHLRRDSTPLHPTPQPAPPPQKVLQITCIFSITISGFVLADMSLVICCKRALSKVTSWFKGYLIG